MEIEEGGELERLILSLMRHQFQKVAFVIAHAMQKNSIRDRDSFVNEVLDLISEMIDDGKLEVRGSIMQPRFSEIRLKPSRSALI